MGRLLAAKANGELARYAGKKKSTLPELFIEESAVEKVGDSHREDEGAWLRATVPALYSPCAGKPWVKYVLKELASIKWQHKNKKWGGSPTNS